MATETVGIDFVGRDGASGPAARINAAINGVASNAQRASGSLATLGSNAGMDALLAKTGKMNEQANQLASGYAALGKQVEASGRQGEKSWGGVSDALTDVIGKVTAIGALGMAGKFVVDLARIGEESAQLEARFIGFQGGVEKAAASLGKMNSATEGMMSRDAQMIALNSVMASGLVQTADSAAQLAQAALYLGSSQESAASRVQTLTNALISGRDRGLIPYGIDIEKFRQRVAELKTGEDELSKSQAALTAFMEQAPGLMDRVAAAGGRAGTSFDALAAAWENLMDSGGDNAAPFVTGLVDELTQLITVLDKLPPKWQNAFSLGGASLFDTMETANKAGLAMRNMRINAAVPRAESVAETVNLGQGTYQPIESGLRGAVESGMRALPDTIAAQGEAGVRRLQAIFASSEFNIRFNAQMPTGPDAWGQGADWQRWNDQQGPEQQAEVIARVMEGQARLRMASGVAAGVASGQANYFDPMRDQQDRGTTLDLLFKDSVDKDLSNRVNATEDATRAAKAAWKDAAADAAKAWKEAASALFSMPGMPGGSISAVTEGDMALAKAGMYQPKVDETLRQLKDWAFNNKNYANLDPAALYKAAGVGGLAGGTTEQKKAGYAEVERQWQSAALFADPANLKWLNKDAVKREQDDLLRANQGKQNVAGAFGVGAGVDDLKSAAKSLEKIATGKAPAGVGTAATGKDVAGPQTTTPPADMKAPVTAIAAALNTEVTAQAAEFTKAGSTSFGFYGQGFIASAESSGLLLQAVQRMVYSLIPKQ